MRPYEVMVIYAPGLETEAVRAALDRLSSVVTDRGGSVSRVDVWGRRRLAYIINRHSEGIYVVMQLRIPPRTAGDLESQLRINEDVLRHLLVRKDE